MTRTCNSITYKNLYFKHKILIKMDISEILIIINY